MGEPDWSRETGLHGGNVAEIPLPHIRRFPGPAERVVKIIPSRIFQHYHTRIEEEDNPIWNSDSNLWQEPWGDEEGRGRSFFRILDTPGDVERWVEEVVAEHFSGGGYHFTDWMSFLSDDPADVPGYIKVARNAARKALRREGD